MPLSLLQSLTRTIARACRPGLLALLALFAATSACVSEDARTGEMVPRGNQR